MSNKSKITTDHDEIKSWADERDGKPASVKSTKKENETGILRIDFPGYSGNENLHEISWDEFFEKFENENLAFLYQEELNGGEESRFFKLVDRNQNEE